MFFPNWYSPFLPPTPAKNSRMHFKWPPCPHSWHAVKRPITFFPHTAHTAFFMEHFPHLFFSSSVASNLPGRKGVRQPEQLTGIEECDLERSSSSGACLTNFARRHSTVCRASGRGRGQMTGQLNGS